MNHVHDMNEHNDHVDKEDQIKYYILVLDN